MDDNADALTTMSQALRIAGFVVGVALDGQGALDVARVIGDLLARDAWA